MQIRTQIFYQEFLNYDRICVQSPYDEGCLGGMWTGVKHTSNGGQELFL